MKPTMHDIQITSPESIRHASFHLVIKLTVIDQIYIPEKQLYREDATKLAAIKKIYTWTPFRLCIDVLLILSSLLYDTFMGPTTWKKSVSADRLVRSINKQSGSYSIVLPVDPAKKLVTPSPSLPCPSSTLLEDQNKY